MQAKAMALAVALLVTPFTVARADDEIVRGAIVKIEAQEIYVNIGVDRGVAGGASAYGARSSPCSATHASL